MNPLTSHQSAVLHFIRAFQWKKRRSPSLRDIARHFRWVSLNAAWKHVEQLRLAGQIELGDTGSILFPREALNADYFKPFL
jgi:hypothetical protein